MSAAKTPKPEVPRLTASLLFWQSFRYIGANTRSIAHLAAFPFGITLATTYVDWHVDFGPFVRTILVGVVSGLAFVVFAVALHRRYLLHDPSGLRLGKREIRFAVRFLLALVPAALFVVCLAILYYYTKSYIIVGHNIIDLVVYFILFNALYALIFF